MTDYNGPIIVQTSWKIAAISCFGGLTIVATFAALAHKRWVQHSSHESVGNRNYQRLMNPLEAEAAEVAPPTPETLA